VGDSGETGAAGARGLCSRARYLAAHLTDGVDAEVITLATSRRATSAAPDSASRIDLAGPGATMSTADQAADRLTPTDVIAGLLAASSVVLSALGMGAGLLLQVGGHPGKLIPIAAVLAIVAGVMSERFKSMALKAIAFSAVAFVVGMTIVVLTEAPLF
jgi:hypothetical protein